MDEISGEQNVFIKNGKILEMTGVRDVSSLSPDEVEMSLSKGSVAVDGADLKIESFSSETGKIRITGEITGLEYFERSLIRHGGLFRKKG